jgi:hypothetical protein
MVPITRSTKGFCQGERDAVRPSAMSMPSTRHRNSPPVDAVAIAKEIARRRIIGERLDELLSGPGCGRGISDVEVHDLAAMMQQDHEYV